MSHLDLGCRALLTTVFILAVAGKTGPRAFAAFVDSLAPIRWIGAPLRRPLALASVAAEAMGAVLVWIPATVVAGYVLSLGTLAAFTATLVANRRQGATLTCRCFGYDAGPVGRSHVLRNVVLCLVAASGLTAASLPAAPVSPAGATVAVLAGAFLGLLATRLDDLLYVLPTRTRG